MVSWMCPHCEECHLDMQPFDGPGAVLLCRGCGIVIHAYVAREPHTVREEEVPPETSAALRELKRSVDELKMLFDAAKGDNEEEKWWRSMGIDPDDEGEGDPS